MPLPRAPPHAATAAALSASIGPGGGGGGGGDGTCFSFLAFSSALAAATEGATRLLNTFDCTLWSLHHCSSSLPDASAEARPVVASTNAVNASKSESSRAWG